MSVSPLPSPGNARLIDYALQYLLIWCWSVIPVIGKAAAGLWKPFQEMRPDEATLRRQLERSGITGIGVIPGAVSNGLAIRDFDVPEHYHVWAEQNPDDAARLPTVKTSRGFHIYGWLDHESYCRFDDGELIGDSRHYALVPPSLHPSGLHYTWLVPLPEDELPQLPPSLTVPIDRTRRKTTQADPDNPSRPSPPSNTAWWTSHITKALPTGPGQRNHCLWELARKLKFAKPDATPNELRAMLREWHRQALPFIATKDFGESWSDFTGQWERVRRPAGQSIAEAGATADAADLPPGIAELGYDGHLVRLAKLCWQLAQQWRDRPFPLGCEVAGQYLGVTRRHAARLLKTLSFDGVIELAWKGTKSSKKASEWRWKGQ